MSASAKRRRRRKNEAWNKRRANRLTLAFSLLGMRPCMEFQLSSNGARFIERMISRGYLDAFDDFTTSSSGGEDSNG